VIFFAGKRKASEGHSEFSDWSVRGHQTRPGE